MWGMIATWRMAVEGITKGAEMLKDGGDAGDAIESAIREKPHRVSNGNAVGKGDAKAAEKSVCHVQHGKAVDEAGANQSCAEQDSPQPYHVPWPLKLLLKPISRNHGNRRNAAADCKGQSQL